MPFCLSRVYMFCFVLIAMFRIFASRAPGGNVITNAYDNVSEPFKEDSNLFVIWPCRALFLQFTRRITGNVSFERIRVRMNFRAANVYVNQRNIPCEAQDRFDGSRLWLIYAAIFRSFRCVFCGWLVCGAIITVFRFSVVV